MKHWVGWYRRGRGQPWIRACESDNLNECAELLSRATRDLRPRPGNLDEVLTSGGPPYLPEDVPAQPTEMPHHPPDGQHDLGPATRAPVA
jgi:hypothetical protein